MSGNENFFQYWATHGECALAHVKHVTNCVHKQMIVDAIILKLYNLRPAAHHLFSL